MNCKGFTLMEVLVVVAIIGILVAIAVPNYLHALESSRQDACIANQDILAAQVERYRLSRGGRPIIPEGECLSAVLASHNMLSRPVLCPLGGLYALNQNGQVVCSHEHE